MTASPANPSCRPIISTISEYFSSQASIISESAAQNSTLDLNEDRSPSPSRKITKLSNHSKERQEMMGCVGWLTQNHLTSQR